MVAVALDLPDPGMQNSNADVHRLKAILTERITELLTKNPEKLMAVLYRLDVREHSINEVFNQSLSEDLAENISDLIIARQIEKLVTRRAYAQQKGAEGV